MIRLFLPLCKCFHKIKNLSETNAYAIFYRQIYDEPKSCPYCGAVSSDFHKNGQYLRNFVSYEHNQVISSTINVRCVACSSCGHSHALLPSMLIPYSSFSIKFIITLLYYHIRRKFSSVSSLCEHFQISIATFYRIYKCFLQDGLYLQHILHISVQTLFTDIQKTPPEHTSLEQFYLSVGYSFLQPRVRIRRNLFLKNLSGTVSRYLENVQASLNEL